LLIAEVLIIVSSHTQKACGLNKEHGKHITTLQLLPAAFKPLSLPANYKGQKKRKISLKNKLETLYNPTKESHIFSLP